MGVFSDNPVLERELRGRLRLRRKGRTQSTVWVGVTLGLVILYFYARGLIGLWHSPVQDSVDLWPLLLNGLLALIVLLSPALSSTAITQERQQQTWDSLATTRLTGAEIILGKWIGRQVILWLLLALTMPYLLGCAIRGGIGLLPLLAVLFFLLATTAFYSALGLLCSFQVRRTAAATAISLTLTALLCIGTVIVNFVIQTLLRTGDTIVMWINPFYTLDALVRGLSSNNQLQANYSQGTEPLDAIVGFYLMLTLLLTFAALFWMISRYRRAVRDRE